MMSMIGPFGFGGMMNDYAVTEDTEGIVGLGE